jgi:hypothetical protein
VNIPYLQIKLKGAQRIGASGACGLLFCAATRSGTFPSKSCDFSAHNQDSNYPAFEVLFSFIIDVLSQAEAASGITKESFEAKHIPKGSTSLHGEFVSKSTTVPFF